jgi:hypothetical protein
VRVWSFTGQSSPAHEEVDMSDNPKDRSKVNVNEPTDIAYWCDKFGCSQTQLRTAVKVVGTSPSKVRTHLADRK